MKQLQLRLQLRLLECGAFFLLFEICRFFRTSFISTGFG
jgi:hypothetical protein